MSAKASILLIEDMRDVRETYKLILEGAGYEVDTAMSKKEALEKLRSKIYDVALVDLQLKDDPSHKGGIDVLQHIQTLGEGTKSFAVTNTQRVADSNASWRSGIFDFLMKENITAGRDLLGPIEKALANHKRVSFGSHGSLAAYLAKPDITPIWEGALKDTIGCSFDAMQALLWKALNPFFPILRRANNEASLALNREKKSATGTFWSKGQGCAVWLSLAGREVDLIEPPGELKPKRKTKTDAKGACASVWEVKLGREQFADSLKEIMPSKR